MGVGVGEDIKLYIGIRKAGDFHRRQSLSKFAEALREEAFGFG